MTPDYHCHAPKIGSVDYVANDIESLGAKPVGFICAIFGRIYTGNHVLVRSHGI